MIKDRWCFINCELTIRSQIAERYANLLMPLAVQLSRLLYHAAELMPADRYDVIVAELTTIIFGAYHAIEADRDAIYKKNDETELALHVALEYGQPSTQHYRCYHPLAHVLFRMVADLIDLDEYWCALAWNADLARTVNSPEQSAFLAYMAKQEEWLDQLRQLRVEIKSYLKILKEVCHGKPTQELEYLQNQEV